MMQARMALVVTLSSLLLAACSSSSNSPRAVAAPPATNSNGTPVTGIITAVFDPSTSKVPFPTNLLLSGTRDLTLNIPAANPNNFGDPTVALNALDGFGTITPWSTTFSVPPNQVTVVAGQTVRLFEVTLTGPGGGVTGVVRELASPAEFVTAFAPSDATGRTLAIVPTKPLKQLTSYMAVLLGDGGQGLTNAQRQPAISDANGNDVTADQTYFLAKRTSPLCVNGASTDPLIAAAQACALEPLRRLTNSQEAAAAAAGIDPGRIVLSWVATTQAITPVLQQLVGKTEQTPAPASHLAPTGLTLGALGLGLPPVADIVIGTITLPYYLATPTAQTPTVVLTGFWHAAPGAYVAPFNAAGLDPTSTNVTFANPFPVATSQQTIPVLVTVPNAASGRIKPAAGWPIVVFQHGITRNRTDAFAIAATLAAQGFAVIAIDAPLHGITDITSPFYIRNTPFAAIANERTFDVDLTNNATGASGPDGQIDSSGSLFINLSSLLTSRDNLRQAVADLVGLVRAIPSMSFSGAPDFDGSRIEFVGQSLGSLFGTMLISVDPHVNTAVLSVPGGGIARLLDASPTFGPRIHAGLQQLAGLAPGTPDYDRFFVATQTVIDSGDPINFSALAAQKRILVHEVVGGGAVLPDQVIPNSVAGAPLSGTEPFIRVFGLSTISASTQSTAGIRGAVRFTKGDHGSLLNPAASATATVEMQGEMASMIVSDGHAVQVTDTSVIRTQ